MDKHRNLALYHLRKTGMTYQSIANMFGISRQAVWQIVARVVPESVETKPKKYNGCNYIYWNGEKKYIKVS